MKSLTESINTNINEAREVGYRVTFLGFDDEDELIKYINKALDFDDRSPAYLSMA